ILLFLFKGAKKPETSDASPPLKEAAPKAPKGDDHEGAAELTSHQPAESKTPALADAPVEEASEKRPPDVQALRKGLARSRADDGLFGKLRALFGGAAELDDALAEQIEEVLLSADVGNATTQTILSRLREGLSG